MKKYLMITCLLILFYSCSESNKEVVSTFSKNLPSFPIDEIVLNGINKVISDDGNKKNEFGKTCGNEYEGARTYHHLDINNDNKDDFLIFMTIEGLGCGASDYSFFLLTSLNENGKYKYKNITKIGGKGSKSIDFDYLSIKGDSLYFQTKEFAPDGSDPLCCPSIKNKVGVHINNF